MHGVLFWKHHNGVLLRCLEPLGSKRVLRDLHDGPVGEYFHSDTTTHKVMRIIYYWPTLFKDAHAYARKCPLCQRCVGHNQKLANPFFTITVVEPFQQWGLNVIGEIFPHSSKKHRYACCFIRFCTNVALSSKGWGTCC